MTRQALPLYVARFAEGLFALLALFCLLSLPWPLRGAYLVSWLLWFAAVAAGAGLAWTLRRASGVPYYLAAILSTCTLAVALFRFFVIAEPPPSAGSTAASWVSLFTNLAWASQLLVAVCLVLARAWRAEARDAP